LVGRERFADVGESEPLYLPPSTALAGRMYVNDIAQVTAGKKYGALYEVQGVKFDIQSNVLEEMVSLGLIPMVYEFGQVQAFSPATLFKGTNLGLQTYSVVRTFDWIAKCFIDYLNRMLFLKVSNDLEDTVKQELSRFLYTCKMDKRLIESYDNIVVQRDDKESDRVNLYVNITPFFPVKNYVFKLDGRRGKEWKSEITQ
jgi:hypothetical protein